MKYSTLDAIGYSANFTIIAVVMLIKTLEKSGAISAGSMKIALGAVLRDAGAEAHHLDYQFVGLLLGALERSDGPQPPCFEVIAGGKQD